jgi:hypothetical protein
MTQANKKIFNGLKPKNILKSMASSVLVIAITFIIVKAGDLFPSGNTVAPSLYTLGDIYNKLTDNTSSHDEGDHNLDSSGTPESTFYTLKQIYEAIPTLDASKILEGTTYMGVEGGAVAGADLRDMFSGSLTPYEGSGSFPGGSVLNGGVDDWNNGSNPPEDRYEAVWTQCTLGNDYCGTFDDFAQAKDNNTNLIWALPCAGAGCSSNSTTTQYYYTWNNSGEDNNSKTAQQLCSGLGEGWYLPHQKELLQAYIDGSYGNLEFPGTGAYYWSATTMSGDTDSAWSVYLSGGNVYGNGKGQINRVRCVRPAN